MRGGISAATRLGCATLVALSASALAPVAGASVSSRSVLASRTAADATTTTTSTTTTRAGLPSAFSWFTARPAPATFRLYRAVQGTAIVADPPRLKQLPSLAGSLAFAARGSHGAYYAFLNVTPQQGAENVDGWAAFRLAALRTNHAQRIHEEAAASNLAFNGGTGACVIDDYVTEPGNSPFHEIACFVVGPHTGSVIVVATPPAQWRSYATPLERVISSYRVT